MPGILIALVDPLRNWVGAICKSFVSPVADAPPSPWGYKWKPTVEYVPKVAELGVMRHNKQSLSALAPWPSGFQITRG